MLTLHAMGWNKKKTDSLHEALSKRYVKTCERLEEERARLHDMKQELECSEEMVLQWLSDVKEWADGETLETSDGAQGPRGLQQTIEELYLSVKQRKNTLYSKNDSSKIRHRLRRKLAEDKKLLIQEVQKYNNLALHSASKIDESIVEHSLTGDSTASPIWPWEVHGSANISVKKKMHDQVMLTTRLQEEKTVLVLEMAQHCTWLQNFSVLLKTKVAEEGSGNKGLCCLLKKRLFEVLQRLEVVVQQYKTALGPVASTLLNVEDEENSGFSSPDTSEDEDESTT
ncbi:uncharacterized protein LOC121508067 isoform X2 [Cheilinus undulatus]|nr:uncharacterized protein LOC121508067 isoform X2 [Cheilinus undulatus]XP_041640499.1 uncharacterized protein LOC121508067 isoform X2 [Cheilinus undulatus]